MSHNLSQPERFTITGPQGETYRGGNQEWYRDLWQRRGEGNLTGLFLEEMWQLCQKDPEDPVSQLAARFGLAALENGEDAAL